MCDEGVAIMGWVEGVTTMGWGEGGGGVGVLGGGWKVSWGFSTV